MCCGRSAKLHPLRESSSLKVLFIYGAIKCCLITIASSRLSFFNKNTFCIVTCSFSLLISPETVTSACAYNVYAHPFSLAIQITAWDNTTTLNVLSIVITVATREVCLPYPSFTNVIVCLFSTTIPALKPVIDNLRTVHT